MMIGAEGATVGPLRVAYPPGSVADGDPPVMAHAHPFFGEGGPEPRDHGFGLGFVGSFSGDVVIGEGAIEGVLAGDEVGWEVAFSFGGVGVVVASK